MNPLSMIIISVMLGAIVGLAVFWRLYETTYQKAKAEWNEVDRCASDLKRVSEEYFAIAKHDRDDSREILDELQRRLDESNGPH